MGIQANSFVVLLKHHERARVPFHFCLSLCYLYLVVVVVITMYSYAKL